MSISMSYICQFLYNHVTISLKLTIIPVSFNFSRIILYNAILQDKLKGLEVESEICTTSISFTFGGC